MPQYWLTTHWPPVRSGPQDNDRLNVHIQDKFKDYLSSMRSGDRVLFYETASGPPKLINGKLEKREKGRQAIVCDARVATPLELRPGYEPEEFNGRMLDFRWQARTDDRRDLLIPRAAVIEWLGYGKGYTFQGFNAGRGILESMRRSTPICSGITRVDRRKTARRMRARLIGTRSGWGAADKKVKYIDK